MPLFRYICSKCHREFELLQPRFDSPGKCPECGSPEISRRLNRIGAIGHAGRTSCAAEKYCPSAGGAGCGCGCCGHGHQH